MADGSLWPAVIGLGGTTVGALIGFGASLLTQRSLFRLNKEADERKYEAEKRKEKEEQFVEFIKTIYEQHYWLLNRYRLDAKWDASQDIPVPPFATLEAIQLVYFPEFARHVKELITATRAFEGFFRGNMPILRQLDLSKPGHVTVKENLDQGRAEYDDAFNAILTEITEYARREFRK